MPQGRVKRYERNAGYGFIETEQGDLFVHHTALRDRELLLAGQQVEFQVEQGDRGPRAVNVRVIEEVSPKRKNQPDWRGRRGGTPRFEDQEPPPRRRARTTASRTGPSPSPDTGHEMARESDDDLTEDVLQEEATQTEE
jgi:CspA family cold shock protein